MIKTIHCLRLSLLAIAAAGMLGASAAEPGITETTAKKKTTVKNYQTGTTIATADGQTVVDVRFYAPSIVRVVKYPASMTTKPQKKSYTVIIKEGENLKTAPSIDENDNTAILSTENLKVSVDKKNGLVTFNDAKGTYLTKENESKFTVRTDNDNDKGKLRLSQTFSLDKEEGVFGLGQLQKDKMNLRGEDIYIWKHNTYTPIPYYTTQKGYGIFWDNQGQSDFKSDDQGATFMSEVGLMADYYFMYADGSQDGVIDCIRQLTGQATMFPLWTMGHWQCRERYKTSDELAEALDKYRELGIPLDGIVQDWQYWGCDSNWNAMKFQNPFYINKVGNKEYEKYLPGDLKNLPVKEPRLKSPEDMVKYVHQNNGHLMISIWANFGPWTEQFAKLKDMNALLPFDTWPRNRGVMPYDVWNPEARDLYWKYLTNLYKMGFDAWWTDSSEPDHFEHDGDRDYMTHDGTFRSVKNSFALLHNKGIYEHQRAMKGNSKRSFQMTRSGGFGEQHYGTCSWSGDIMANWDSFRKQVPTGLNFSLCGIPFWNNDIGGFFYWEYNNDPKSPAVQELKTRWMEYGCFMPIMRNHCSSPMVSELYNFGSEGDWAYDAMKKFIKLRYRLLPYTYSTAGDVVQNSGTMMRALVMDFPKDDTAINLNDEYMYGRSLLVKPVTSPLYTYKDEKNNGHCIYPDVKQASAPVTVYLPKGTDWYDFWTNTKAEGGKTVQKLCPIDIMPVYVKAGTVMPFGPEVQYSDEKPWDNIEIRVYPGADGEFVLYEDEGDNYNYEKGQFTTITFKYDNSAKSLTIGSRKGSYKGMLKNRKFNIILVDENSGSGHLPMNGGQSVDYDGSETTIKL